MFNKVLIANRGEIALRVLRACKELGIQTVAVYSTADRDAMHVRLADESVCIGPPPAKDSYLNVPSILAACEITGADAVHPGYGFLSENARFARILNEHKITFIGPSEHHISIMGDKITAKQTAVELGIPVVPGSRGAVTTEEDAKRTAAEIGYPVLIKATAGGGGRGMKVAYSEADLLNSWSTARTEAKAAFGNDSVYMEKFLGKPRHIEVQVMGDGQGNAVHLGTERITGVDLVYEQIRVASGEKLSLQQENIQFYGHAIEVRINAEDPATFTPSPGQITFYHPAGGVGVRVDSAVYAGYKIPPYYDSLIGKLIVYGRTREECLQRLGRAVDEFVVDGIKTTLPLFQRLIKEPDIIAGDYDIHWLENFLGMKH
jgi:acetyl-CoA carboxylase biotin carboxylase subunit